LILGACAPNRGPRLVGEWRDRRDHKLRFASDGSFADGDSRGSFTVERQTLSREWLGPDGVGHRRDSPFYLGGDRLAPEALLPVGVNDGIVGQWEARITDITIVDGRGARQRDAYFAFSFDATGRAHGAWSDGDEPLRGDGRYTLDADGACALELSDGATWARFQLQLVDGAALARATYARAD
jgi:hypothetical protein